MEDAFTDDTILTPPKGASTVSIYPVSKAVFDEVMPTAELITAHVCVGAGVVVGSSSEAQMVKVATADEDAVSRSVVDFDTGLSAIPGLVPTDDIVVDCAIEFS